MQAGSVGVWRRAIDFHWRHRGRLARLLPALCVPFLTDELHSVLIAREHRTGTLDTTGALREALGALPSLVALKIGFEIRAAVWSILPLYGTLRALRYRVAWAMASNVVVFENLPEEAAGRRCVEIADGPEAGPVTRALIVLPSMMMVAALLVWVVAATWAEHGYSYSMWLFLVVAFYVLVPGSAAANTFAYLDVVAREREASVGAAPAPSRASALGG